MKKIRKKRPHGRIELSVSNEDKAALKKAAAQRNISASLLLRIFIASLKK